MKMKNAKQELLDVLSETNKTILCAVIEQGVSDYDEGCTHVVIQLKLNYTTEDYEIFLNNLNFEYDAGFGSQLVWGTVWLSNNTWLERGEYDGCEWWNYMSLPVIPDNLKGNKMRNAKQELLELEVYMIYFEYSNGEIGLIKPLTVYTDIDEPSRLCSDYNRLTKCDVRYSVRKFKMVEEC